VPEQTDPTVEDIAARLRAEDARTRRLTRRLTLLPVLVGALVAGVAYWSVNQLGGELQALREQEQELSGRIEDLQAEEARLAQEVEARKTLFAEYEQRLPPSVRRQASEIQAGLEQMTRGQFEEAISSYQRVIQADPKNSLALNLKGTAYYRAKDYRNAVDTLRLAVEADPRSAAVRYSLALALAAAGRDDEAVRESDTAFELDPNLVARAATDPEFWPLRRLREARAGERTAGSASEKEHIAAGIAAAQAGELEKAIAEYDLALSVNPGNASVLNWRGYALYRLRRTDSARDSLQRAVAADPQHAEAHYNLALVLWRLNAHTESARALQRAFALDAELALRARGDAQSRPIIRYLEQNS
jgi:tetratricopeptide (TPR) repeat protein